jgi:hypothetical protein
VPGEIGDGDVVQVGAEDWSEAQWRTSSLSAGGNCVQVAFLQDRIGVRHSKDQHGPMLVFNPGEWDAFTGGVRAGEFDRPR